MQRLYRNLVLVALWLILLLPAPVSPLRSELFSQPHAGLVMPVIDGSGLGNECDGQSGAGGSHGGC